MTTKAEYDFFQIDSYLDMLIVKESTITEALKKLDSTSNKVLFISDESQFLLGTLTDGDIRRAILSGENLDSTIENCYNSNPKKAYMECLNIDSIKEIMLTNRVEVIPIVNESNRILGFINWDTLFGKKPNPKNPRLDLPVVIMAGGKGTRMAPFTNVLPKPLIPIGDKTIMEIIIDNFQNYGINEFVFTLNYRGEMIKAYFDGIKHDYDIEYIWEKKFNGTASSLGLIKDLNSDFIVSNCDIIVNADISKVLNFHKETKSLLTVISSIQHQQFPYGVIEFEKEGKITGLREKPEFSFPINTGVYILSPECLDYIPHDSFFHMTHLIEKLIESGERVSAYPVNESDFIDIGQWDEYRSAVERLHT